MKVSEFRYELPERLIAQEPSRERDAARLMILDRNTGRREHRIFRDLLSFLRRGDLLVLNDTRVIPARLSAVKPTGGRIEVLLLERDGDSADGTREAWRALVRGFGRAGDAARFTFAPGIDVEIAGREAGNEIARVILLAPDGVALALERAAAPPTPPYIRRRPGESLAADRERYQTVYAAAGGAVAAPTAGLHFTGSLLDGVRRLGVEVEPLTLHVGWGTFQPVRVENVEDHRVASERYVVSDRLASAVGAARERGGRVIAVGTTVARALEFTTDDAGGIRPGAGRCDLVILPGHHFRAVDALITNFHLPESSLLILVAAFAGRERLLEAYREAIGMEYRFYSYGDAMLIV